MTRDTLRSLHLGAAVLAPTCILAFQLATAWSEIGGDPATIAATKRTILWGLLFLVPALAIAGLTGRALGKGWKRPKVAVKQRRMAVIASLGILVLVPSAILLARWSAMERFDGLFYAVQGLELTAGLVNLALLGLNIRDGRRLRRPLPRR